MEKFFRKIAINGKTDRGFGFNIKKITIVIEDCWMRRIMVLVSLFRCSDDNNYDSKCQVSCDIGFKLKGSKSRKCEETGDWNGNRTACEGDYFTGFVNDKLQVRFPCGFFDVCSQESMQQRWVNFTLFFLEVEDQRDVSTTWSHVTNPIKQQNAQWPGKEKLEVHFKSILNRKSCQQ